MTPARPRYLLLRALLTANAVVIAVFPGAVVLGGYLPDLPTVGRFGVYLTTNLIVVLLAGVIALAPALLALRLGGGRFTKALVLLVGVVIAGTVGAGGAIWATAATSDLPYSPFRQLASSATWRGPDDRVVFATVEGIDLHADLYLPPSSPTAPGPALVWIHGGAFIGGELGQRPWLFQAVTDAGFAVLDIEYRLAPPPRWRDAPGDVLCALAWLGEHAGELAIDPARVTVSGDSAGGSLALVAGYIASRAPGTVPMDIGSSCGGTPVVPGGVLAVEPAADLEGLWQDRSIDDGSATFPEAYIGGPPVQFPERYDAASPFAHISADVPRTLIITGANDHLVHLPRVRSIVDALDQAQARYKLIVIPFADHGLDGTPTIAGSQMLEVLLPRFMRNPEADIGD